MVHIKNTLLCLFIILFFLSAPLFSQDLYFENPRFFGNELGNYPSVHEIGNRLILVHQKIIDETEEGGQLAISFSRSENGRSWENILEDEITVSYEGSVPAQIYSSVISDSQLLVAVTASSNSTEIYRITNVAGFARITRIASLQYENTLVSPKFYRMSNGSYILFGSQAQSVIINGIEQQALAVVYSTSIDGITWTNFQVFETDTDFLVNFNPSALQLGNRFNVVFQNRVISNGLIKYQLFLKYTDDFGQSWSESKLITDFQDRFSNLEPAFYDNQRPHLSESNGQMILTWERAEPNSPVQAYRIGLDSEGNTEDNIEPISSGRDGATSPFSFVFDETEYMIYFTRPTGASQVVLATGNRGRWRRQVLNSGGIARFPVVLSSERLHIFWQQRTNTNQNIPQIVYLEPDQTVAAGRIIATNHIDGGRYNITEAAFRLVPPSDISGIAGYSVIWSRQSSPSVPTRINLEIDQRDLLFEANREGSWTLGFRVQDEAGNWSSSVYSRYILDLTPPKAISFSPLELDDEGFAISNNITVGWSRPSEEDFSHYQFRYSYLGFEPDLEQIDVEELSSRPGVFYDGQEFSRYNEDNGTWLVSIKPVDDVGNVGEVASFIFSLNKYIPVTIVNFINRLYDELGRTQISLQGRGFTANGIIDEIVFDQDGQEPFDYVFKAADGSYNILGDRLISNLSLDRVSSGVYRVFLNHTERGRYVSPRTIELQDQGVIKFGNYEIQTQYTIVQGSDITSISVSWLAPLLITILAAIIGLLSVNRLRVIIADVAALKAEARALVEAKASPAWEREQKIMALKQQGISLRVKFTVFVVILVISVVLVVSLPLSDYILSNQQQVLAQALEDRVSVLMESLTKGAAPLLENAQNETIALSNLTTQSQALAEAEFVTITGRASEGDSEEDGGITELVWASNDPLLLFPDTTIEGDQNLDYYNRSINGEYLPGAVSISDPLTDTILQIQSDYDTNTAIAVGTIPADIDSFTEEIRTLIFDTSASGAARRNEIDTIRRGLNQQLENILREQTGGIKSIPQFEVENFNLSIPRYQFYQLVYFRQQLEDSADRYYQGMVRIGISTDSIVEQINTTQDTIRNNILIFAAIAIVAGTIGAYLLATLTVIPIRKLVTGVELIRDTDRKQDLKNHQIEIKTRDELNLLSEVINQMTKGLVKAAEDNQELMFGKDVQKMFIQLDAGADGQKLSTGHTENEDIDIFGYYEGAKGVSGDYFYYQKISQDTYAIIKCDVAGKGIPAALIMVEVATLFLNHFTDWQKKVMQRKRIAHALKDNAKQEVLAELVYNINDLVAEREFKGKFAALNIALLNEKNGEITYCNAGDNQVHTYRAGQSKVIQSSLNKCPAAGVFNSKDMPISFIEEKDKLESGDILLMFTDGIEEAKRLFRDQTWNYVNASEEDKEAGRITDDIQVGMDGEEFTIARIHDVVNAVKDHGRFSLTKYLTPLPNEDLNFDFSELQGTSEDVVLALIAVEKIFRLVPDPSATIENKISIDKKVDDFLKKTFEQYSYYFHHPIDEDPARPLYNRYSHVKEDDQYDDLTILALRKK